MPDNNLTVEIKLIVPAEQIELYEQQFGAMGPSLARFIAAEANRQRERNAKVALEAEKSLPEDITVEVDGKEVPVNPTAGPEEQDED